MKRLCIIIILSLLYLQPQAQTPNFNEWFAQKKTQIKYLTQQIAALKVYLEYLKKGYDIAQKGLTTISAIKNGSFNLHKTYFASLKAVSPIVKNSSKVYTILYLQPRMMDDFKELLSDIARDIQLTHGEKSYIASVYQTLLASCTSSIEELEMITTTDVTEMEDGERLSRLDKVYEDILEQYAFTQDFIAGVRGLSVNRAKEGSQVASVYKLYRDH